MDEDIEKLVKAYKSCALAAKLPTTKLEPWPKTDTPWSRLHIGFAGPINGSHYLVVVHSFTDLKFLSGKKNPTSNVTLELLEIDQTKKGEERRKSLLTG